MAKRKGRKIGRSWSYRLYKIDGKKRKVKVRKIGGRTQVRVVNKLNLTDKTARKRGRRRKKGYVNNPDRRKRRNHPRKRR